MVVIIMALILGIIYSVFLGFRAQRLLGGSASKIVSMFAQARSRTVGSEGLSQFGMHIENTKAVLFKGSSYSEGAPDNEEFVLNKALEISAINLEGGASDVVFEKISGKASASGSITLSSRNDVSSAKTIIIEKTGLVYVQ